MMIRASGMVLAAVVVLSCTAASAQSRFSSPRYFNASHSRSMTYVGATHISGGSCGCTDCGAEPSFGACGCDAGPSCGGCGHCGHCCPRILPAVARGVGAVADFVGDTLDCIFCVPRVGCCGTSDCCDRPRACLRPARKSCCASNCCDSGCTDCASGYEGPSIPEAVPAEEHPMAPATSARSTRMYSTPRTYSTSRAIPTRSQPVAITRTSNRRPTEFTTTPASATSNVTNKVAPPRELQISSEEISQLATEYKPEVRKVERTSEKSMSARVPSNPLRR